jgi:hypothetical protein
MSSFGGQVAMAHVASRLSFSPCFMDQTPAKQTIAAKPIVQPEPDEERRLPASIVLPPLVEAVGYDEAPMAAEGVPEHR